MPRKILIPDLQALATQYGVSSRTVRRWHRSGADVADPASVASHLITLRRASPAALESCKNLLQSELNTLTSHE
jgi:hypothetical protein